MENKINIAELLKDCPKGMELDCTMYDNLYFNQIYDYDGWCYKIGCYTIVDEIRTTVNFTEFGTFNTHANSKCVIFPKGKTTWEGFQIPFKDGDIVFSGVNLISIFKCIKEGYSGSLHSYVSAAGDAFEIDKDCWTLENIRFATEKEKEKLFKVIKDNGYNWNPETKTLNKLVEPKFKVGDKVRGKYTNNIYTISRITPTGYELTNGQSFTFDAEICHELVSSNFDFSKLVPFESKVLVRNDNEQRWIPAFWGGKREDGYVTTFGWSKYCVPYEGNEHLLDKTDDCDSFYKTWE